MCIDPYGKLRVERGLLRPDPHDADNSTAPESGTVDAHGVGRSSGETAKPAFSAALMQELSAQKTAAIRAELAHNPGVALVAVVHALLLGAQNVYGSDETCLELRLTSERPENSIKDPAECKGLQDLGQLAENCSDRLPGNPADLLDWCLDQSPGQLLCLLAFVAGKSVNALQLAHFSRCKQRRHADKLAPVLTEWFTPTAGNYFGRIIKAGIEEALMEEKTEAAAYAERKIAGTGWLPETVRVAGIEEHEAIVDASAEGLLATEQHLRQPVAACSVAAGAVLE